MAVPFSNTKLRVPKGFQNILEGLAREILRNQPENAFEFGSKYFQQLLQVREETGHDPAVHGARIEDRFYNNDSFKSPSVDPNSPQQQDAALKIQTGYRKHAAEQEVAALKEDDAAQKIQAGFRGYQDRQKFSDDKSPEKQQEEEEEVDIDLNDPDVEKAAVKIQAGFKGFKARQEIKDQKEKQHSTLTEDSPTPQATPEQDQGEEVVDIDLNDPEVNAAAIKIQAGFRGFQTRKDIGEKQEKKEEQTAGEGQETSEEQQGEEGQEATDLDLTDPELAEAALKIQTGFRGHLARKEVEAMKETSQKGEDEKKDEEEEVDINLEDPDVESAALKIQAGFKGMKARQEIKALKDAKDDETKIDEKQEDEVDIDLNDPETEKAALKIQAGFKGFQTRKELKEKKDGEQKAEETPKEEEKKQEEEEVDIDLNDPEVAKAATKIQAGFKGYKTRKEISDKKESGTEPSTEDKTEEKKEEATEEKAEGKTEGEEVDIDLNDPEVAKAATKIQAGFKGFKTRQELEKKKSDQTGEEDKQEGN